MSCWSTKIYLFTQNTKIFLFLENLCANMECRLDVCTPEYFFLNFMIFLNMFSNNGFICSGEPNCISASYFAIFLAKEKYFAMFFGRSPTGNMCPACSATHHSIKIRRSAPLLACSALRSSLASDYRSARLRSVSTRLPAHFSPSGW
jgi:hypothetical protein